MDESDLTMEEYIRLEEEKAQRLGQSFDWRSATYGKVNYFDDIDYFKDFESDFPAIVFNETLVPNRETRPKPTISSPIVKDLDFDFKISFAESDMALPSRDQRHPHFRFDGLEYSEANIDDFVGRLGKIFGRGVHKMLVLDFGGLPYLMAEGLTGRMVIEHRDSQG
ncbi:hypothetical protein Tco_1184423 [Tanacetum coccineum]